MASNRPIVGVAFAALVAGSTFMAGSAQAATIAQWDLLGEPGNQVSTEGAAPLNVVALDLTRGGGVTASAAANSFSASGWQTSPAANPAGDEDFFSLGFTVADGFEVDLEALYIGHRSSNTGPGTMGLFYSGNGFASPLASFTLSGGVFRNDIVDLSGLDPLTGLVEFRLIEIGNDDAVPPGSTATGGTYRVTAYFEGGAFNRNLQFTGEVTRSATVDAPAGAALSLLALLGVMARRRA
jgi:hypothetical protein